MPKSLRKQPINLVAVLPLFITWGNVVQSVGKVNHDPVTLLLYSVCRSRKPLPNICRHWRRWNALNHHGLVSSRQLDSISRPTKEFHIYSPCGQEGFRPPVRSRQIVLIDQMIHIERLEVHSLFLFFYSTICASTAWVGWWVCPLTQFIFSSFFPSCLFSWQFRADQAVAG